MKSTTAIIVLAMAAVPASGATRLLVPAYFDPSQSNDWNTLVASVSSQVPITAIMNPNSGPVAAVDSSYTAAINSFQAAGGLVVAYVHTSNGTRSISAVENDIATYKSEYPQIKGIFLDEMANTSSKLSYYKSVYSYIKNQNSSWQVIGNPGTSTLSTYLSPTPAAADELVTFENNTGYSSYTPSAWQSNYSSSSFANIVYAVPDKATMASDLSLAMNNHAGNVYFSNLTGVNPYSALPGYWTQEVAAVRAVNGPALMATFTSASSGDYNAATNWSCAVPNAIDAEADFLGAITANRTVYSDIAITAGKLIFNNSKTYALSGAGSLRMETTTGTAVIAAQSGVQKIELPILIASNTTLNASSGATLIITGPVTVQNGQSMTEVGPGIIRLQGALTVQTGGTVNLLAGSAVQSLAIGSASYATEIASNAMTSQAVQTSALSIGSGSSFNLGGQDMIVHSGDLLALSQMVRSGATTGTGLIDSAATQLSAIGVIANSNAGSSFYQTFDGAAVSATDVLIKSTTFGDANLDGVVNAGDYTQIETGFSAGRTGWFNGDFNYDGVINGSDYTLIDNAFNREGIEPVATTTTQIAANNTVPEPTAGLVIAIGAISLCRRRTRTFSALRL